MMITLEIVILIALRIIGSIHLYLFILNFRKNEVKKSGPGDLMSQSKREVYNDDGIDVINSVIQRRKKR